MYDKAARDYSIVVGSTPSHVGPGSYDVKQRRFSRKSENYAPFMSLATRKGLFSNELFLSAPGPGYYDVNFKDVCKGGGSPQFKAERFRYQHSKTPGPGTYDVKKSNEVQSMRRAGTELMRPVFKLINSKLKFYHRAEAPSIPFPGLAYGYEESDDGSLKKQDPPKRDTTLGPAFYNPNRFLGNSYKGCHFGNYTSSRGFYHISKVPGPGEYNVTCAAPKKAENINSKQAVTIKHEVEIPRYLDAIVKKEEKMCTPGPAEYNVKSQFDLHGKQDTTNTEHPPFYSQAKRFTKHVNTNPAPGFYNDPRCALERLKKASSMKMSPFGQTSVRFHSDLYDRLLPGPGSYNIESFGSDIVKKAYLESTRRGIFGSSAPRSMTVVNKDVEHTPGPSHYNVKEKPFHAIDSKLSSFFASTTKRDDKAASKVDVPGPDSYNVSSAFEKSQIHPARAKPRRSQSGFLSGSARFDRGHDFHSQAEKKMVPGPGSYDIKSNIVLSQKQSLAKSERFYPDNVNDVPGPGSYELSPMFADTLVKGTFNVNLANQYEVE